MNKAEAALKFKHEGHNCCQAVLCAFAEELGWSVEMPDKLGIAFGGGMGCMEGTCGALCGAEMVLGLLKYDGTPVRKDAAALYKAFTEKCGASICRELKGAGTGKVLCECDDCVQNAAEIVEKMI